ncbi:O-antigen ligase family protein [Aquabacterium sp. OR-4]|uniref:O-antigen ligase family protein n=1 Tax=Aquabacterium sp. OR-4 TaxID=2978127 RepID=UPI0021B4232E|nr:O-antigen ligase family protein [Aquabacterium sp. OR-4]MDT7835863.1 O-antigen ligase family protein [Aquabacterium sp. OR-4]
MRRNLGTSLSIVAAFVFVALLLGLMIVVFPLKFTGTFSIAVLGVIGIVIALLLPDSRSDGGRIAVTLLVLAVATKFLWPSFSYIPVPGLPFKNPQRWVWLFCMGYLAWSLMTNATLRQRAAQRLRGHPVSALVLMFFGWRLVSCAGSEAPIASLFTTALEIFDYLPAYLMAITWIRDERDARTLTNAMAVVLLLVVCATLVEARMQSNPFMALLPYDPTNSEFLNAVGVAKFRAGAYRAQATFNHALLLAQFLACMLPLAMASLARAAPPLIRLSALGGALLLPVAMWATHTRTAVVAASLVLGLMALVLAWRQARRHDGSFQHHVIGYFGLIAAAALLLMAAAVAYYWTVGRTAQEAGSSLARLHMLELSFDAFAESPILGHGPGSGAFKAGLKSSDGTISIDSYFLTQLVESGLFGFVLFCSFFCFATAGYLREAGQATRSGISLRLTWCLLVLAFGFSALVLSTPHNMALLYLALGVLVALSPRQQHANKAATNQTFGQANVAWATQSRLPGARS